MAKKTARQLDAEIAQVLSRAPRRSDARKKKKTPREIQTDRLKALQGIMADVYGDDGWFETDIDNLEGWIRVEEELGYPDEITDRQWFDVAKKQLEETSVLPEHAGASPPNVRAWNDVFISTYNMNIDDGMSEEDAIASARQNAHDSVSLESNEHGLTKTDPKLYDKRLRWRR